MACHMAWHGAWRRVAAPAACAAAARRDRGDWGDLLGDDDLRGDGDLARLAASLGLPPLTVGWVPPLTVGWAAAAAVVAAGSGGVSRGRIVKRLWRVAAVLAAAVLVVVAAAVAVVAVLALLEVAVAMEVAVAVVVASPCGAGVAASASEHGAASAAASRQRTWRRGATTRHSRHRVTVRHRAAT
eukprot:scaffold53249_cov63-Phaeocystis_antarctica.AAC.1